MTTVSTTDEVVEVTDESASITVVVSTAGTVPVSVQSGDFVTVEAMEETVTLLVSTPGDNSAGGGGAVAELGDIGNVTEAGRADGAVLEYDATADGWRPTNGMRNQVYDGGNF